MSDTSQPPAGDRFNLSRFVSAQDRCWDTVWAELQAGEKVSHWMWYVFPQIDGLGSSSTTKRYAISGLDEANAYLAHPVLGKRLLECCRTLLSIEGKSAAEIFGYPDDLKLKSSMTLFSRVPGATSEFQAVLDKYYQGEQDQRTINLLRDR